MRIKLNGGMSAEASHVPQEHLTIARHFNAGSIGKGRRVPEGRPKKRFSRPCGTLSAAALFPALKRQAIFGQSLRDSAGIFLAALVVLFTFTTKGELTNGLSDAETKGRELAQKLCNAWPEENLTNSGVLQIRDGKGWRTNIPVRCLIHVAIDNWQSIYETTQTNVSGIFSPHIATDRLTITHFNDGRSEYQYEQSRGPSVEIPTSSKATNDAAVLDNPVHIVSTVATLSGDELLKPFAGSDFWVCDLGLAFFHWPQQKVLPKTPNMPSLKLGREYTLLESINLNPPLNGYSRVLTWIDKESGGILQAEAYDSRGKRLKIFEPKSFKKVNGHWQLEEMQIRNDQTGSRTRLEFDLKKSGE